MSISVSDFIQVAKLSLEHGGEEWTRNSISRGYCGMYHSAILLTNGKTPDASRNDGKPKGVHVRLSDYLCAANDTSLNPSDVASLKKIGLMLKTAHAKRVAADYHLNKKINRIDALSVITDAEKVIFLVDKLMSPKTV